MLTAAFLCFACGGTAQEDDGVTDNVPPPPSAVELPGTLIAPTGDTLAVLPDIAVVVYYWLPLELYEEAEEDLIFLASLGEGFMPLPVQPDHDSRNHAQTIVNDLEISLPVYLADSVFMESMDCRILPVCRIMEPGGTILTADGFGSPRRLLSDMLSAEQ